jgi:rhodanese-related sulfurtransferase
MTITAQKDTLTTQARVQFFTAKLNAEWGPIDLKHALDAGAGRLVVLDTRSAEAYAEEHIPQAINIPTEDVPQRLNEIPKDKDVVAYCWNITCHLATRAALTLAENGYRVHELAGGIDSWKNSDLPVTKTSKHRK